MSDLTWIDEAFPIPSQRSLNKSVRDVIAREPKHSTIFQNIGKYILSLRGTDEPPSKKRKVGDGKNGVKEEVKVEDVVLGEGDIVITVKEISFSIPARKKFTLLLTKSSMSAVNAATGVVEFGVPWSEIQYVACLPVPDKAARQWNFCVFPRGAEGLGDGSADALVFTIPDGAPKTATGDGMGAGHDTSTYKSLLIAVFGSLLDGGAKVLEPDEKVFYSAVPQSHRKGEKAFHVKAHVGSKEGYLFFLKNGIMWAFKKPLIYFSFAAIESVSYTSITKRTLNLSIHVAEERGDAEFEFSMIDQEEYAGIDTYIKGNRLNDASMAEARRAKKHNVNGKEGEDGEDAGNLQKALEELEDEEEEDYVPGGDKDDDGSGSDDSEEDEEDEEDDEDGDEGGDDDENMGSDDEGSVDLEDELGSELEDVNTDVPRAKRAKR
ncbi:unnamed protein product [Tuber aestivum]|uniref:Histone chaperone RTT106/FACT complex subunit SPT16-like middle domain-containing protein n=1 Tax=Tuber aestivum TaxID=59557 RepID=A0A292PSD0_9PEZI|nr:unnamed protein product [Tuber aestivum]